MPARILVVDDDRLFHRLADAAVRDQGFVLLHAMSGAEALELLREQRPDIVLTDYLMPGMDGLELCRSIRALDPEHLVPVVLMTGEGDSALKRTSLEAGIADFVTKPLDPIELGLRLRTLARMTSLHKHLAEAKFASDEELGITKHILQRLVEPGLKSMPRNIHMETFQTQRINGDACAYQQGLPGIHFGMICDATGHGLVAGVSTIPAIQAFLSMVKRDIPLEIIYQEINRKLREMLPIGRFVCLMLIRLDLHNASLSVLNAGLPDAMFLPARGGLRRFSSRNLPARLLDEAESPVVEEVAIAEGDRLVAFTDGMQDVLGDQDAYRLIAEGLSAAPLGSHTSFIHEAVQRSIRDREQTDDVSWALWEVPPPETTPVEAVPAPSRETPPDVRSTPLAFELSFDPRRQSVREMLPDCLRLLTGHGVSQAASQSLALTLTEAATNALDHGLLRLESSLKQEGFEAYDTERKHRLAALEGGRITLRIRLLSEASGPISAIAVEVEDSGPGFDWRALERPRASGPLLASGRGLLIIRSLAPDAAFNESGNCLRFTLSCG